MEKRLWLFLSAILVAASLVGYAGWRWGEKPDFGLPWLRVEPQKIEEHVQPVPTAVPTSSQPMVVSASTAVVKPANAMVEKVVDGDTLEAKLDDEGKIFKIRLLGINTPETVDPRRPVECFGKEASNKMKELLTGKRIRLEADPQADERDKYGRLLRNAFLEDGTDINAFMVREGYAYAYLSFPLDAKRKKELKKLQEDAKMAQRGLWNPESCNGIK